MGELGHIMRGGLNGSRLGKAMGDLGNGRHVGIKWEEISTESWGDRGRNQLWEKCGHNLGGELNRVKVGKSYGRSRIWEKCGHNIGGDLNRKSWEIVGEISYGRYVGITWEEISTGKVGEIMGGISYGRKLGCIMG